MHRNCDEIPQNPTFLTIFPSPPSSSTSFSSLVNDLRSSLFLKNATRAGVITVPLNPIIAPLALATVIDSSENPISSKYVIRVAEYASTVKFSIPFAILAGHMPTLK